MSDESNSMFPPKGRAPSTRVKLLLSEEKSPFVKEIEHERIVNSTTQLSEGLEPEEVVKPPEVQESAKTLPARAIAIPRSSLYDPNTYVSHSSKLNPENSVNLLVIR